MDKIVLGLLAHVDAGKDHINRKPALLKWDNRKTGESGSSIFFP